MRLLIDERNHHQILRSGMIRSRVPRPGQTQYRTPDIRRVTQSGTTTVVEAETLSAFDDPDWKQALVRSLHRLLGQLHPAT